MRRARDRFETLAGERAVLLQEVNHRVGNSLQLIAAMLQMQSQASPGQEVKTALLDAATRVMAVSPRCIDASTPPRTSSSPSISISTH